MNTYYVFTDNKRKYDAAVNKMIKGGFKSSKLDDGTECWIKEDYRYIIILERP